MVINNASKTVRVYYSNSQKINGGAPGSDFVIASGTRQLVSGFENGDNTNNINFRAPAWDPANKQVPVSQVMSNDRVYEIIIPASEDASQITVTEKDGSTYYN
jgi:hypothetical protein